MVSLAASQKLYIIPEQAKIVPIGKKPARERPALSKKAL
jgi:hypothetical protein